MEIFFYTLYFRIFTYSYINKDLVKRNVERNVGC